MYQTIYPGAARMFHNCIQNIDDGAGGKNHPVRRGFYLSPASWQTRNGMLSAPDFENTCETEHV